MGRFTPVMRGQAFRDDFLALMATRFDARAVDRKRRAWDWLFATPEGTADCPTAVFTVERDGQPAGAFMRLPCRYVIDGRDTAGIHMVATVVHPDHTGAGPMMLHAQLHVQDRLCLGVPNRHRLSKAYTRYDGQVFPGRYLRQRIYRPGAVLAQLGKVPAGLGTGIDLAGAGAGALTGMARARLRRDERVEPVDTFDRAFDAAWENAAPAVAFAQARSAAFLTWRYRDMPLDRYESLALRRAGRLAGYVVTAVQQSRAGRVGRVSDIFAYDGTTRDYALLLAAADERFRRADCAIGEISYGRVPAIEAAARRSGFLRRKEILPFVMRHDIAEMNAKLPAMVERIHFCRGDHDEDY